jgi:hypothetical protein
MPGEAVSRLVTGTRTPLQTLARGLAEMAKRLEPPAPKPVKKKVEPNGEEKGAKPA